MGENHQYWQGWAQFLQHWGLRAPASAVLEAAGPLADVVMGIGVLICLGAVAAGIWAAVQSYREFEEDESPEAVIQAFEKKRIASRRYENAGAENDGEKDGGQENTFS